MTPTDGGRSQTWRTWANALTTVRLLLAAPCAWSVSHSEFGIALGLFLVAVATDFVDGPVARSRGEVSAFGGFLDHASDATFVVVSLAALARLDLLPAALPIVVAIAFVQYTLDSRALAGAPLRASRLGRWNGIMYFVIAGVAITSLALPIGFPTASWLMAGGYALVLSTLLSMIDRAYAYLRRRATR